MQHCTVILFLLFNTTYIPTTQPVAASYIEKQQKLTSGIVVVVVVEL